MKNGFVILIIGVVLAVGYWKWSDGESGGGASAKDEKEAAKTAVVEQRDISFSISVAGEIGPAEQVSVRPEVSGRISQLDVDIGDRVKQGELLFTLDDKDLQIEVASQETEITRAQLEMEKARQEMDVKDLEITLTSRQNDVIRAQLEAKRAQEEFERQKKLHDDNLVSQEVYNEAKTNFELAKNTVFRAERDAELAKDRLDTMRLRSKTDFDLAKNAISRAERNLELAKDRLSRTRIEAPFDCTVLTRPVSVGQAVSGSGGFNAGTEVLTIADLNEMVINAHVNQADITRLQVGMKVDVQVEAVIGLTVKGEVERIAPQATIKNGIKGFDARILLKNIDPRVQPGMTAKIAIPVQSAESAVAVPLAAIFTEREGRHVFVVKGDKFERRPVKIGVSDYRFAEALEGLTSGETVSLVQPDAEAEIIEPAEGASKAGKSSS